MRQLITRIDDRLHARLRQRARAKGRSVNALVNDMLVAELAGGDLRSLLKARAREEGRLVVPPARGRVPSREAVEKATSGAGTAASDVLAAERAAR